MSGFISVLAVVNHSDVDSHRFQNVGSDFSLFSLFIFFAWLRIHLDGNYQGKVEKLEGILKSLDWFVMDNTKKNKFNENY